jgi:hypothetical protein
MLSGSGVYKCTFKFTVKYTTRDPDFVYLILKWQLKNKYKENKKTMYKNKQIIACDLLQIKLQLFEHCKDAYQRIQLLITSLFKLLSILKSMTTSTLQIKIKTLKLPQKSEGLL